MSPVKERFREETPDATYHGFNFSITIDDIEFRLRNYDDMPGVTTVISPVTARRLRQARPLVDYLVSVLSRHQLYFYDEQSDIYRPVVLDTLEFAPEFEVNSNFVTA